MKALRATCLAAAVWMLIPLSHAMAQPKGIGGNERIVLSGPVEVKVGETVDGVVVFHGTADIAGQVNGDLIVFDGPVEVSGIVDGDLVAFKGPVTLRETAEIRGDVVTPGALNTAPGAEIAGETKEAGFGDFAPQFELFGRIAAWIGFTVSMFVIGLLILLLGPRVSERLAETGLAQTAPALGWGLVAFFTIPIATFVSFVTLVGIPLGVMLLFGMLFFYPVGYATGALVAGRKVVPGPDKRILSLLAGLAILRIVALVPVLGGIFWFLATAFGLGVIAMAVVRARATPAEPQQAAATPAPI